MCGAGGGRGEVADKSVVREAWVHFTDIRAENWSGLKTQEESMLVWSEWGLPPLAPPPLPSSTPYSHNTQAKKQLSIFVTKQRRKFRWGGGGGGVQFILLENRGKARGGFSLAMMYCVLPSF